MAFINIKERTVTNWVPVSYTANETTAIMPVKAGEMVIAAFCRIRTAFDGGNFTDTVRGIHSLVTDLEGCLHFSPFPLGLIIDRLERCSGRVRGP